MRTAMRFSLMAVTIILVTQLYSIIPVSQASQSENRNRTYSMRVDPNTQTDNGRGRRGRRRGRGGYGNWCNRRCRREYSACLGYADGNAGRRRACAVRYRNCLRRCS